MYRLLLVAILSCIAISGFAKRKIALEDRARSPIFPVEAFIDEKSRELILDFRESQQKVRVVITDLSGNNIFNVEISMGSICILPLPNIDNGEYFLSLFIEDRELYGFFDINNY